jgi:hypothetical protein
MVMQHINILLFFIFSSVGIFEGSNNHFLSFSLAQICVRCPAYVLSTDNMRRTTFIELSLDSGSSKGDVPPLNNQNTQLRVVIVIGTIAQKWIF